MTSQKGRKKTIAADFSAVNGDAVPFARIEDLLPTPDGARAEDIASYAQGLESAAKFVDFSPQPTATIDVNTFVDLSSRTLSAGDLGFSLVGIGQTVVQLANGADPLVVASATGNSLSGLSLSVAESLDTVYADNTSTIEAKYVALKAFSVLAGTVGAVTSIANYQQQRADLLAQGISTTALDVQIGLEAGANGLMALDGILSTLVLTGKITGLAAKAVPILGSVGQLMLSFNPANKVLYDVQENAIADAKARDQYSSALAASLLQDRIDTQQAGDTDLLITNLVSGGLGFLRVLAGFGAAALAPLGTFLGAGAFVAGAVTFIIQMVNESKMRKLAEEAREKILDTDGVTNFQDFFDLSFEDKQARLLEAYEEVVQNLTQEQGFGSVIGLSTARLTADDITVAQEAKIADQVTKSAETYLSEYRDGGWTDITATIEEVPGPDVIRIAASDEPVYFTALNEVLASGARTPIALFDIPAPNQVNSPEMLATTYGYSDFDGWTVIDEAGNQTTFDLVNIITLASVTDVDSIKFAHNVLLDAVPDRFRDD